VKQRETREEAESGEGVSDGFGDGKVGVHGMIARQCMGAHLHSIQHFTERPGDLDPRYHGVHGCGGRARHCPVVAAASTGTGTGTSASASTSVTKCAKMHPKQMGKNNKWTHHKL
jgi:hypothetical protein